MKKILSLLFAFVFIAVAHTAHAQRGMLAIPAEAELNKFPIFKQGELTTAKQAELELRAIALADTMTVFNYFRDKDRFVLEILTRGTLVYVDKDGVVRYKADCTNRIVKASDCPKCLEIIAALRADSATRPKPSTTPTNVASTAKPEGLFLRILRWIAQGILILAAIGLGLLVLFLIFALLGWILRELLRLFEQNTRPNAPAAVAPAPAPQAPAPAPAAVPVPVVVTVTTTAETGKTKSHREIIAIMPSENGAHLTIHLPK